MGTEIYKTLLEDLNSASYFRRIRRKKLRICK